MRHGNDKVQFETFREGARIPTCATDLSAGLDLYACEDTYILPFERAVIRTGLTVHLDPGYYLMVCSRSGMAAKHGVFVLNAPGIIDADYAPGEGDDPADYEIKVILQNFSENAFNIHKGDRIAQVIPTPLAEGAYDGFVVDSATREGGFGSTGE